MQSRHDVLVALHPQLHVCQRAASRLTHPHRRCLRRPQLFVRAEVLLL
jgi:hypothetical protein